MSEPAYVETIYRSRNPDGSPPLSVGPWPAAPQIVWLHTEDADAEEWYGRVNIALQPKQARELAHCLLRCADDAEREPT